MNQLYSTNWQVSKYKRPFYRYGGLIELLSFPRKRLFGEKNIVVPCLDLIMIAFFPRNIVTLSFCPKSVNVNVNIILSTPLRAFQG